MNKEARGTPAPKPIQFELKMRPDTNGMTRSLVIGFGTDSLREYEIWKPYLEQFQALLDLTTHMDNTAP